MDNSTDLAIGKPSSAEQAEDQDKKPIIAIDLWKELNFVPTAISNAAKDFSINDTLKKILDSIPKQAAAAEPAKKAEWTIAINFTTDFGHGEGVDNGRERLKEFAKQTKGKDVTIVAQAAVADTDDFDWDTWERNVDANTKYKLHRYLIKDGEMNEISTEDSKGYAADLQGLLTYASKDQPSKKIGLLNDSHGIGNEGLTGDSGKASVAEFVAAVKNGLKDSGKEKLDMIDFDACLMGANGALGEFSAICDNIVASAETESIYQGQNYMKPIERLLAKPTTDGFTFCRDIVSTTHKDMERWKVEGTKPAIETLAHFHLREYKEFKKSLDVFGEKLISAMGDSESREAIEASIDNSKKYGSDPHVLFALFGHGMTSSGKYRTDLKQFTENVLLAVDKGIIKDDDRSLKKAAQEVLSKRSTIVDSYFGEGEYEKCGGISDFIPNRNMRNLAKAAELSTSAGKLADMTNEKSAEKHCKDDKSVTALLQQFDLELASVKPFWFLPGVEAVSKEVEKIDKCKLALKDAKTKEERKSCYKDLHLAAVEMAKHEHFAKQAEKELSKLKENTSKVYTANLATDNAGWTQFRHKLRDGK